MPEEADATVAPDAPSVADVERIAGIADPILRNLAITHCYSRLAAAVARRTGAGANWCTFATWASRQAGSTIRGEDAMAFLRRRLTRRAEVLHPVQSLWRSLLRRGLLNPGSRLGRITAELHTPFDALIGLHEQTRLQPEIRAALDAPYATQQDLGRRLLEVLLASGTRARRAVPDRPAAAALGWVAGKLEDAGAELAREVITESFMVLSLPGRVLALGAHLPDAYPEPLRELTDQDLAALIARFEPVAPAPDDCGARDWAVLEQRMHYIVHLFRATHEHADLFQAPFTPAQVSSILAGAIPDGELG